MQAYRMIAIWPLQVDLKVYKLFRYCDSELVCHYHGWYADSMDRKYVCLVTLSTEDSLMEV